MAKTQNNPRGFTLIEVLVVMGIISLLSGIAIPSYKGTQEKARIAQAKKDLKDIRTALVILTLDTDRWPGPSTASEINNGLGNESWDLNLPEAGLVATNGGFPDWNGPYLNSIPEDPWGNDYFFDSDYQIDGADWAVIGSFGPNKVGPNLYDSDDIIVILYTD